MHFLTSLASAIDAREGFHRPTVIAEKCTLQSLEVPRSGRENLIIPVLLIIIARSW